MNAAEEHEADEFEREAPLGDPEFCREMDKAKNEGPKVQLSELCPGCGKSYWTVGGVCNTEDCGEDRSAEIKAAQKSYRKFLREGGE